MKRVLSLIFSFLYFSGVFACDYLTQSNCNENQRCIYKLDPKNPICIDKYDSTYPEIKFPFSSSRIVTCDQGPNMPGEAKHSHAWLNAMDALDLRTDDSETAAKVHAGLSGKVVIYDSCLEFNTNCGAGFGNQVKIFSEFGYIIHYAHLEKVLVKDGQIVTAGEVIGIEGNTGLTGLNNRHLHMSVHYNWKNEGIKYWSQLGWLPRSIPFSFKTFSNIYSNEIVLRNTKNTKCIRRKSGSFLEAAIKGIFSY